MSEFIIDSEQLERLIEAIEHDTWREINRVVIDGVRAMEIVRCRDCAFFKAETRRFPALCRLWLPRNLSRQYGIEPDGFCAWGERRETTCKCGESIELGDREYAVCPSCGRTVRE